jgi:hypothetical protein
MPKIWHDSPTGPKVDADYLRDMSKEGAYFCSRENLFSRGQLVPSDAYREGWERIFGKDEDNHPWDSLGVCQGDMDEDSR